MGRAARIIPVMVCVVFLIGAGIRFAGDKPLLLADMVYRAAGEVAFPGTKTPEDAAVSFYMYIDRGMYDKAYEISIEPDFTEEGPAPFKEAVEGSPAYYRGITGRTEFVDRLEFELGRKGMWIKLHNIRGKVLDGPCPLPEWLLQAEGTVFGKRSGAAACVPLRVSGHLLGACTIFSWEKTLPVVETKEGWKVVLPGTKGEKQFYYQDWIMNIVKIFDLRGTQ